MQVPLHPLIVHLPIVVTFILPALIIVFALLLRGNKMPPKTWLLIVGLQLFVTTTGYVALDTGETEEEMVKKVVEKELIHKHEEAAEIFVGSTVLALVLGIAAFFLRKEFQFSLHLAILAITLVSGFLAYRAGKLGGELVYIHQATSAYGTETAPQGILPTPGMNTSESPYPVDNESLKPDEHDYGNPEEEGDEEGKLED